jgi:hypothetical protein
MSDFNSNTGAQSELTALNTVARGADMCQTHSPFTDEVSTQPRLRIA